MVYQHTTDHQAHQAKLALDIVQQLEKNRGFQLIIVDSQLSATRLERELLFFAENDYPIECFSEWETLPYDAFSPHEDIISKRIKCLNELPKLHNGVMIVSFPALMNRLPPKAFIAEHCFQYHIGQKIDLTHLTQSLAAFGYRPVSQVYEPGDFAVRGSIIDIFPSALDLPCRLELFDNEIETIRYFDPESQTSIEKVERINILPAHEFLLDETGIKHFRHKFREQFSVNPTQCSLYTDVSDGIPAAGLEYFIPLFFDDTCSLIDYLPEKTKIIRLTGLDESGQQYWREINTRYEQLSHDVNRPILSPSDAFFHPNAIFEKLTAFINDKPIADKTTDFPDISANHKEKDSLAKLQTFLSAQTNHRVLFTAFSKGRREVLKALLSSIKIDAKTTPSWQSFLNSNETHMITLGELDGGLINDDVILISEAQLLGEQAGSSRQSKSRRGTVGHEIDFSIRSLAELKIGEAIVHIEHGVGRFQGLETITHNGVTDEFIKIQYANSNLFVPVTSLNLVSRYSAGDSENAPLHTLGTDKWKNEKRKAKEKVRDVAAELLAIYAKRQAKKGFAFKLPLSEYQLFSSQFPFIETKDQERAIEQILNDMQSGQAMDRLLCGDVGFGKTEVAMRAAFLGVMNHKQVVVLAPTTLLAQQHFQTFSDRFADFPVKVAVLSRFVSTKGQNETIQAIADGKIDIVISTHKILNKAIKFKSLGLLIIDEEHRFGVKQKEALKAMRTEVDILTMTATPIPRTLNMAFANLRDLSIISTPPAKRLAIKTFIQRTNKGIIRDAILREILRGGQVYFLHNNVETIEKTAQALEELVPEARIGIGHGQMREKDLERTMIDFYHRRFNVLVSTTIIETGIDIPSANTIIIDRADKFGLAQLHQLRGRVGRSHHQAYAYLLIPDPKSITKDAQKRLEAIGQHEDLGSGFMLATHDLEIRGAGELLGESQSGEMHAVGFTLYMEMLDRAVQSLHEGKDFDIDAALYEDIQVEIGLNALIPEDYLPDIHLRLLFYKRISNAKTIEELNNIKIEMIDRLGLLPEKAEHLFTIQQLKQTAKTLDITKIIAKTDKIHIHFTDNPAIDFQHLLRLIKENKHWAFSGPTSITIAADTDKLVATQSFFKAILKEDN